MRIVILILIILSFLIFAHWFARIPGEEIKKAWKKWGLLAIGGLLIVLALAGRLHWLFALLGGALPLLGRARSYLNTLSSVRRLLQRAPPPPPDDTTAPASSPTVSHIETKVLHLELNKQTGVITGRVLSGGYAGRKLQSMQFPEIIALLRECRSIMDVESVRLLEIYLRRHHQQQWEAHNQHQSQGQANTGRTPPGHTGETMTVEEACALLGVKPTVSKTEITAAHKRLIQKLHPDRGGTDYLAAKINMAKEILLRQHR